VGAGLLQSKEDLTDLEEALSLLHLPEIKTLAKEFNLGSSNKSSLILEMLAMARKKTTTAISSFFTQTPASKSASSLESKMLRKAKELVPSCYKLDPVTRSIFLRVLCLWGLSSWWEARDDSQAPSSLTAILLANQGKVVYPQYTIRRETRIFQDRSGLLNFEAAVRVVDSLEQAILSKDFQTGYSVFLELKQMVDEVSEEDRKHVSSLPPFLAKFTSLAILTAGLNRGVELLEKMKQYEEATQVLRSLLADSVLPSYRGHWYDRLSLDMDAHLKQPVQALAVVEEGLKDCKVRSGRKLLLVQRALKICKAKKSGLSGELERLQNSPDWDCPRAEDLPTVTVHGRLVSKRDGQTMGKSVFQVVRDDGDVQFCGVEELVKYHYATLGLTEGLHAEGAVFSSLLGLLLWEQIYDTDLPDVFRSPGQTVPLDWGTDHFYTARKEAIDLRLEQLREMDRTMLGDEVMARATQYQGVASLVSWTYFTPLSLAGLTVCMEPMGLVNVIERMVKDHRNTRSGLPDLTVWDSSSRTMRMVEVKGPGDRLSTKQILWIRFLNSVGVRAEVCHVLSTGSKGIVDQATAPTTSVNQLEESKEKLSDNGKMGGARENGESDLSGTKKKQRKKKVKQKELKSETEEEDCKPKKTVIKKKLTARKNKVKNKANKDSDEDDDWEPIKTATKKKPVQRKK